MGMAAFYLRFSIPLDSEKVDTAYDHEDDAAMGDLS